MDGDTDRSALQVMALLHADARQRLDEGLAVASAALGLCRTRLADGRSTGPIDDALGQIDGLMRTNAVLSPTRPHRSVADAAAAVVDAAIRTHAAGRDLTIHFRADDFAIEGGLSIIVASLVGDLVSTALRREFPPSGGCVWVDVAQHDGQVGIMVIEEPAAKGRRRKGPVPNGLAATVTRILGGAATRDVSATGTVTHLRLPLPDDECARPAPRPERAHRFRHAAVRRTRGRP